MPNSKKRTEEVVASMTSRILAGGGDPDRLRPGQFLSRGEVEGYYQIAPQTSQAVIRELVALGIVEIRAGSRAYVAEIPAVPNLGDLAELCENIEMSAVRYLVGAKMTRSQLPTVVDAQPTVVSCASVNADFHAEIVHRAGSVWDWRCYQMLTGPLKLCLIQLGRSLGPQQLREDHESLLRACVDERDTGQAAGILSVHWVRIAWLDDLKSPYLSGVEIVVN